jgi:hypothetical protein
LTKFTKEKENLYGLLDNQRYIYVWEKWFMI